MLYGENTGTFHNFFRRMVQQEHPAPPPPPIQLGLKRRILTKIVGVSALCEPPSMSVRATINFVSIHHFHLFWSRTPNKVAEMFRSPQIVGERKIIGYRQKSVNLTKILPDSIKDTKITQNHQIFFANLHFRFRGQNAISRAFWSDTFFILQDFLCGSVFVKQISIDSRRERWALTERV